MSNEAIISKPDREHEVNDFRKSIFLAGSIENNLAINWQKTVEKHLKNKKIHIYNPRRDSWNPDWPQKQSFAEFNFQVNWELDHLDKADFIFMYFDPNTKSPISLLELGLYANTNKLIVCCPRDFWRRGNVEIVCARYNITLYDNLEDALGVLDTKLHQAEVE